MARGSLIICLAMILFSPLSLSELQDPQLQEKAFLKALGLTSRPQPSDPRPVPVRLWKMFQRRSRSLSEVDSGEDICRMDELGVEGDTLRHLPNLGKSPLLMWYGMKAVALREVRVAGINVRVAGDLVSGVGVSVITKVLQRG